MQKTLANSKPTETAVSCHATSKERGPSVTFKVVPVNVYHGCNTTSTFAFIDEGSSVSLIEKNLAKWLGLSGPKRNLNLEWFGGHSSVEESEMVKFNISGIEPSAPIFGMNLVRTVNKLGLALQTIDADEIKSKYDYLENLPITSYTDAKP